MKAPSFWKPDTMGERRKPDLTAAKEEGLAANLKPASKDTVKRIVVGIDYQIDFVLEDGNLSVVGAVGDVRNFIEYLYGNAEQISALLFTMDQHLPYQIFYGLWWKGENGNHPAPLTIMLPSDKGNDSVSGYINGGQDYEQEYSPLLDKVWSIKYPQELAKTDQSPLIIWPEHCMIGTDGAGLLPELAEAIMWLSAARKIQPMYMFKGTVPQSEHYGPFSPCVPYTKHAQGGLQTQFMDLIAGYDIIDVAGEAEDFCVREGMGQLLKYYGNRQDVIKKMRFLKDCTSLVFPDKRDEADNVLDEYAAQGVQIIDSTQA